MSKKPILIAAAVLASVLLTTSLLGGHSVADIPSGTGFTAHDLCSRTMVSEEPAGMVRTRFVEPKVWPLPLLWRIDHEAGRQVSVRTRMPGLAHPRTAVYRPGLGCTVVQTAEGASAVRAQPFQPASNRPTDARPWPDGEARPQRAAIPAETHALIAHHAAILFSEDSDDLARRRNTTALLVARHGQLVHEQYALGHTRDNRQLGWSMTKTLTAIIAGTLARDQKLELDGEVGLARWRGTPKQAITWRALLNMAPGLAWFEGYGGASDATEMLFTHGDQGSWVADRPMTSAPGSLFTYSTGFSNLAMLRMRQILGGGVQTIYDHYQQRVFAPLGIRKGLIEPDASGTPVGGARGFLRPVDWLRLGQLVANRGRWNATQILPPHWVEFMLAPSPAAPQYGGSIWRRANPNIEPALRARLPKDLVFFAGHQGQFNVVVPSRNLVVLRMGVDLGGGMKNDKTLHLVLTLVADLLESETAHS